MAKLLVRGVDARVAQALKERAARNRCSVEAEHRAILEQALCQTPRRSLAEVLAEMPDVGRDADFARVDDNEAPGIFDGH
ncbi:FitA-like ribbon-helix-helix domain-containing protein [Alkalilimnicola ehrlichii]|uniref:DNA-binding protein n=1 Tax=Alkalilimnicola ehrlichii TaxID=351052 RepID=A0A3E0WY57_9GAMM|nr:DNA-binding protein [Alkalilimnicola ehrlichii]RFA36837.1 DNA-binding protein [Alkalilimnicola ehrlichii]